MLKHPDKIYPGQVLRIPDLGNGLTARAPVTFTRRTTAA